ncbi:hypothetical protein Tco_0656353 [Tanacetum coccineum]|uniref:Tf2-1-like SH3-like domain-containing protein n=1 Tax=Tanacetum coccineum TaxID=301880 RepID=A0ABQ4X8I9_9ASTR
MQAWDKLFEIKHAQPVDTQDLLIKLVEDVRSISEEFAEFINIPTGNLSPSSYDDDDDEESSIPLKDIIIYEEDVHEMSFKTYPNPLFDLDEEIISIELNPIHNEDLDSTPKDIDHLFDEFADELTRLQLIPPGIDIINLDPEGDILFLETLLYDNSSPRPPEAFQANSDTIIDSSSTIPIPVEDSDSSREEIDIFFGPEDSIPPGIESDDFDSEDDDNSAFPSEFESFHVDYPNPGDSTIFKVLNHDDLSTEEKSPQSSSHCDSKAFQLSSDSPMIARFVTLSVFVHSSRVSHPQLQLHAIDVMEQVKGVDVISHSASNEVGVQTKTSLLLGIWCVVISHLEERSRKWISTKRVSLREPAYKLELPKELSRVHNTFHVSNLKKCHADEPLAVPLDGLHLDDQLHFVEEPVEIVGREVKRLKRSRISLVKVRWNSKRGPEFTWEREDQFKKKYPHLFTETISSSSAAL